MSRVNGELMKLWQERCAFTRAIGQLLVWADTDPAMAGYEVALGEGLVAVTDASDGDHDGPHMAGGAHFTGTGQDLLIYTAAGAFIADGAHPAYRLLGEKWRRLHFLARWGGDFSKPDSDHFSFAWGGKA